MPSLYVFELTLGSLYLSIAFLGFVFAMNSEKQLQPKTKSILR